MRQDVEFGSEGETISAMLLTPAEGDGPFPTVVMAGGWCYVKELVQPSYAEVFNRNGIAALIFDYRRLGDSGGEPRQHIDPWAQIEDYKNAISFAHAPEVATPSAWRLGDLLQWRARADRRRDRPARQVHRLQHPGRRRLGNMRRVHGSIYFRRLQELIARDREARFAGGPSGYMPMSSTTPDDELDGMAVPGGPRRVHAAQGERGAEPRAPKHDPLGGAAA